MKELIKVTKNEKIDKETVSAKELYLFLGHDSSNWKRWYTKNIINNDFAIENEDYIGFVIMTNGNKTMDFQITIDFAKKTSMMAKTTKGEEARGYFIECEKIAKKPMSSLDFMQLALDNMREQQKQLDEVKEDVKHLKAQNITSDITYFTISGYASLNNVKVNTTKADGLGRKASRICTTLGYQTGKVSDSRYGTVKTYPMDVLSDVFQSCTI